MFNPVIRALGVVGAIFMAAGATGCATIINGTTQPIAITSTPNGAKVMVDGSDSSYTTPANVDLARGRDHLLTFTKPGYQEQSFTIRHSMSGVVAGNILAGGLIGWGVDAADGAQDKLTPETVQITLDPVKAPVDVGQNNATGELAKLKDQYNKGLITQTEYNTARKRLIDDEVRSAQPQPAAGYGDTNPNVMPVVAPDSPSAE